MRKALLLLFIMLACLGFTADFFIESDQQVFLIGDFTEWKSVPLVKAAGNWWYLSLNLDNGTYHYYFTDESGNRIIDPFKETTNIEGEIFNIFRVEDLESATHKIWDREYFNPVKPEEFYLGVSGKEKDFAKVFIHINGAKLEMPFLKNSGNQDYFRIHLTDLHNLEYYFELVGHDKKLFLGANGISEQSVMPFRFDFDNLPVNYFDTPEWSKGAVYYQIFPERFANGDPSNDPEGSQNWYADPRSANLGSDGFFGGDLQGVINHIDHLKDLGIDAIYFNPIFESVSSHKYDTADYMKIDDNFGDYELFKKMMNDLSSSGIRVILDGVFNHTGDEFWAFQDVKKNGKDSPYWDWYFIKGSKPRKYKGHAMNYIAWGGFADMPKLNVLNPEVQEYIGKVAERYVEAGISGWRLDVAGEVAPEFWKNFFRPIVKRLNGESIIVGEIWGDSMVYLQGDMFDSVMNYQFRDAVIEYVARPMHSAKKFANMTDFYLKRYPPQVLHSLWNMLDSHDTERMLTTLYGDIELFKIAVGLQMTFIGSPVIYYGDEIGMTGGKDPDNRRPMPWKEELWNKDILEYYKKLISFRKEYPALRKGSFEIIATDGTMLAYKRALGNDELIIFANPGNEKVVFSGSLPGIYLELFTNTQREIKNLEVPSKSFLIFKRIR